MSTPTYVLRYDGWGWSTNLERSKHWSWRNEKVSEYRGAFHQLAIEAGVPAMERMLVTAHTMKTGRSLDLGNNYPAVKAAIDGVVDAGVIVDDTPDHLVGLCFTPPEHAKFNRLTLVIAEG